MVDAFGEISFLTRSENRVEVLERLADGAHTERELVEGTGISDVTVSRIIQDFSDRGWVHEREEGYATTRVGTLLAEDYTRLEQSMDLACRLGPVREYLPTEEMDFDFRHLTDARVSDPEQFEPLRAIDRWNELLREADHILGIASAANAVEVIAEPFHEEVTENDLQFDVVVSRRYFEIARNRSSLRTYLREMLEAGMNMYLARDLQELTITAAIYDGDLAAISGFDDTGTLQVGIESRAAPFREWIRETYETYRADARPLRPDDFE